VKILANPVILRAAVVLFCSTFAFLLGLILMRRLRQSITEESEISAEGSPTLETLPLHVYNTVIQQLKQQKQDLQTQSQAELQRARTAETFSQAVISTLSCGVLVFGNNGLVKTSNPAAKEILGFVSTIGMNAEDIFRGAVISRPSATAFSDQNADQNANQNYDDRENHDRENEITDEPVCVADEVAAVLRQGGNRRQVEAEYETPSGEKRFLAVTVSPVPADDGSRLGVACVIDDHSEVESLRHDRQGVTVS